MSVFHFLNIFNILEALKDYDESKYMERRCIKLKDKKAKYI